MWPVAGAVLCLSAVLGFYCLAGSLSFFGVTSEEAYRQWVLRPLFLASGIGLLLGLTAVVVQAFPGREQRWRVCSVGGTAIVALAVLAGGISFAVARDHPRGRERRLLDTLAPPPGVTRDQVSIGSEPPDVELPGTPFNALLAAGHQAGEPPVGVRSWRVLAASHPSAATGIALRSWAANQGFEVTGVLGGEPCSWRGTRDGWPFHATLTGQTGSRFVYAVVVVTTPS
jgi:hypothetical protein